MHNMLPVGALWATRGSAFGSLPHLGSSDPTGTNRKPMTIATLFTWGFVFSFLLQLSLPFPFGRRVHLFMQCPWFALFPPFHSFISFL